MYMYVYMYTCMYIFIHVYVHKNFCSLSLHAPTPPLPHRRRQFHTPRHSPNITHELVLNLRTRGNLQHIADHFTVSHNINVVTRGLTPPKIPRRRHMCVFAHSHTHLASRDWQELIGSVWQCVAVCCSMLQCVAVCCSVCCRHMYVFAHPHTHLAKRDWQELATLQHSATHYITLQRTATYYNRMQHQ